MLATTLTTTLLVAALSSAEPAPIPAEAPKLELGPIASLHPEPSQPKLLDVALSDDPADDGEAHALAKERIGRRRKGAWLLGSSLAALGASFAVMPLADAIEPNASPNQGAMVLRLELLCLSAGAAVIGGYFLASSYQAPPAHANGSASR